MHGESRVVRLQDVQPPALLWPLLKSMLGPVRLSKAAARQRGPVARTAEVITDSLRAVTTSKGAPEDRIFPTAVAADAKEDVGYLCWRGGGPGGAFRANSRIGGGPGGAYRRSCLLNLPNLLFMHVPVQP